MPGDLGHTAILRRKSEMKLVIGAAFAALALMATPAFAQAASVCPAMPPAPTLPDGSTASNKDMQTGVKAYNDWAPKAKSHLECDRKEIEGMAASPKVATYIDAVTKLKEVGDSPEVVAYKARVEGFNGDVTRLNALGETWQKSGDTYNARTGAKKK